MSVAFRKKHVFVYPVFHWGDIGKRCCRKLGIWKKKEKGGGGGKGGGGDGHIGRIVYTSRGFKPSAHYVFSRIQ